MQHHYFGKTVNGQAWQKLAEEWKTGSEFIRKKRIPFSVYDALCLGLFDLWQNGETETSIEREANIYKEYGFMVEQHGIGWKIS